MLLLAALAGEGLAFVADIAAAKSIEAGLFAASIGRLVAGNIRVFASIIRAAAIFRPGCAPFIDLIRQQAR